MIAKTPRGVKTLCDLSHARRPSSSKCANVLTLACDESRDMFVQMALEMAGLTTTLILLGEGTDSRLRTPKSPGAHIRVRSQDKEVTRSRVSPIERIAPRKCFGQRAENFGRFFAQHSMDARVTSVSLVYRGATEGDELVARH